MARYHASHRFIQIPFLLIVLSTALLWSSSLLAQSPLPTQLDLYKVYYANSTELNRLGRSLDVWEVHNDDGYVIAPIDGEYISMLQADGYTIEYASTVEQGIDPQQHAIHASATTTETIPSFPCYRTTTKLEEDMRALADAHPNLAQLVDIGDSWDKSQPNGIAGHDLFTLVITNREQEAPKFRFLIVAAVHARELTPAEIAMRYAEHLVSQYGFNADVTWLLDYGEVHIIPLANPDGREFADQHYYWRKNTNSSDSCTYAGSNGYGYGVDLNRNADMKWGACESGGCSSALACNPTFRGSSAGSEPETVALQEYTASIIDDQREDGLTARAPITTTGAVVSLHSYAQKVLFPWGWSSSTTPNRDGLQALGYRLAAPLDYVSCQTGDPNCLYETDGDYVDWVYDMLGVPAFTVEYGTAFFESCNAFYDDILQQAMESLTLGFKYARQPYALTALEEIESVELTRSRVMVGESVTMSITVSIDESGSAFMGVAEEQPTADAIRLTADQPSWVDDGTTISITSTAALTATNIVTMTLDTSSLATGQHILFVEVIDASGDSGIPTAVYLDTLDTSYAYLPFIGVRDRSIAPRKTR